jgi:hypothetical protein
VRIVPARLANDAAPARPAAAGRDVRNRQTHYARIVPVAPCPRTRFSSPVARADSSRTPAFGCREAYRLSLVRPLEWTTSSSARRYSAGDCFVPDCERVRVNGGAAPRVLQGHPRGREANPRLSPPRGYSCRTRPETRKARRGGRSSLTAPTSNCVCRGHGATDVKAGSRSSRRRACARRTARRRRP